MSVAEAAWRLHVPRKALHELLAERKGFTPKMALRAGKFAGNGPEVWLRMQQAYDLWHAERRLADELQEIERVAA